jgi:hypothetical protein
VRSASLVLPADTPFQAGAKDALIARPDAVPDNV